MKHNRGVTLIELLITISIAVILMTIAVPGFQTLMISNRLSGITTEFMGTLNLARSETVKRGRPVTICRSSNGAACTGAWSEGWLAFVDNDGDATVDGGDTVLRVYSALTDNYTANGTADFITYDRSGMATAANTFAFCHGSDESQAQAIIITRTRPRIATDGNDVGTVPEKENGNNITSCENP